MDSVERIRKGSWTSPLPSPHLQCSLEPVSLDQDVEWLLDMAPRCCFQPVLLTFGSVSGGFRAVSGAKRGGYEQDLQQDGRG